MIITCYKIRGGFAGVPDSISLCKPPEDTAYDELSVILPDGYQITDTVSGTAAIYDAAGRHCEICALGRHSQAIALVSADGIRVLQNAPDDTPAISLREARLSAGLTQHQLADAAGVAHSLVYKIEQGDTDPGKAAAKNMVALARVLGVNVESLI